MHRYVGVVTGSISGNETPPLQSGRPDPGHRNAIPNPNARDVAKGRAEASGLDPDLTRHDTLGPDIAHALDPPTLPTDLTKDKTSTGRRTDQGCVREATKDEGSRVHRCVGVVTGSISGDETPPLRSGRLDPGHRNAIPNPNARDVAKGRAEASGLDPDLTRHNTLGPDVAHALDPPTLQTRPTKDTT